MTPVFFSNPTEIKNCLHKNHNKETEMYVGFYKKGSGKQSITWPEAVDQALCYGWIDSVRKSVDSESYCNRFTPRKPGSNWSIVNINKVEELMKQGLMQPSGLAKFTNRKAEKSGIYSFESSTKELPVDFLNKFKANEAAWDFFSKQPPSYRKTIVHWILSAKQDKTRLTRLEKTIGESEKKKRVL
jgi:uncharacterized protein YdeI (YjbR/CyaY-like superfamily)